MMLKFLSVICLLALCHCHPTGTEHKSDLDSIFADIFGPEKPKTAAQSNGTNQDTETRLKKEDDIKCSTTEGQEGICIPFYSCSTPLDSGLIDIKIPLVACPSYSDVCCLAKDVVTTPAPAPAKREGCGWNNPDGVGGARVARGDVMSLPGEYPWVCAILKVSTNQVLAAAEKPTKHQIYAGSGSLIHPSVVLTAAHLVAGNTSITGNSLRVRAGEWDARSLKELFPHQERDVLSVEIHKDYNRKTLYYDIALLFLAEPMELAPNVGVVCLPPAREIAAGGGCVTTGWGKDQFDREDRYNTLLKKVEFPVVDRASCLAQLRSTRLGQKFELHTSFMCAGAEGKDNCVADGGAPLACPIESEPNRLTQRGIAAWSLGCSGLGAFVDVANLRDWVDDKVVGKGYDSKTYSY